MKKYDSKLQNAYAATVKQGLAMGVGVGTLIFITFATYGLAVCYGAKQILNHRYQGGAVISIVSANMVGGT